MKRILTILLMACCSAVASKAQNGSDQYVDFQIVAQGHVDTPIYRAPAIIPVQGFYSSISNTLYVSFDYDLGVIGIYIENVTAGNICNNGNIYANSGIQAIATDLDAGTYLIRIYTSTGVQYSSELVL
jgi:hypothetical protein